MLFINSKDFYHSSMLSLLYESFMIIQNVFRLERVVNRITIIKTFEGGKIKDILCVVNPFSLITHSCQRSPFCKSMSSLAH